MKHNRKKGKQERKFSYSYFQMPKVRSRHVSVTWGGGGGSLCPGGGDGFFWVTRPPTRPCGQNDATFAIGNERLKLF